MICFLIKGQKKSAVAQHTVTGTGLTSEHGLMRS